MGCGVLIDVNELVRQLEKASPNGVATLDSSAKVPKNQINLTASDVGAIATETDPTVASFTKALTSNDTILTALNAASGTISANRLPSYDDDVLNFTNLAGFPGTGETSKIYIAEDTNKTYRWTGTVYVEISSSATAGEALKLTTPRTISTTGDATYSVNFDGSSNVSAAIALATVNNNVGNFGTASSIPSVTTNAKGQITAITTNSIGNELIAIQALSDTPGFLKKTGDGTYVIDTTNYQTLDSDLTTLAGLAHNNRYFIVSNGTAWTTRAINAATDFLGITPVANGGTGKSSYADGQILFGNNTTNINTSSQLFWDDINKWLKIGIGTPAYPLDVFGASRISGIAQFTNTTASTSTTTGASVVAGGQGIGGNQYVGGNLSYGGDLLGGTTGTWKPSLDGATTNPTVTYNVQLGEYFRLGKLVVANFYIGYTAISGGAGTLRISMPIATKNPIVSLFSVGCISYSTTIDIQKSVPRVAGAGMDYCFLRKLETAADFLISDLPASTVMVGSIMYLTA